MPCNDSQFLLEQTGSERQCQKAAQLLVYVREGMGLPVEPWMSKAAAKYYCEEERAVPELCRHLTEMDPILREKLVYDGKSKQARKLADWWEAHQEIDRRREAREKEQLERERLKAQALSKLSKEERIALLGK